MAVCCGKSTETIADATEYGAAYSKLLVRPPLDEDVQLFHDKSTVLKSDFAEMAMPMIDLSHRA